MTKYNKITPEIAEKLQAIVGAKRFFAKDAVKDDFSHDEMPIYGKYYPEVVCEVESTEEVSQIMRLCYENNIPVTPRGAGTGLVGGCVPLCGGVVLCTTRMNKILSYDMNNLVVHIQPGVLLCDLAADALTRGLMYPPDPGEKTATVGGNVSTNAGGMRAVKYGVTRDYVLAMTVVLPDGRVMELGKTVCKTSSGYSLLHLMIGSEGTLGIITELTLKLIPKPNMDVSLILPFADVETAIASVPQIKLANLDPQSIEFMERDIVDSSAAFTGNSVFPTVVNGKEAGAYILVTLVGDSEAELTAKMDRLGELAEKCGAYDTLVVWTDGLKRTFGRRAARSSPSSRRTRSCSTRWTLSFPLTASPSFSSTPAQPARQRALPSATSATPATATCCTSTAAQTTWSLTSSSAAARPLWTSATQSAPSSAARSPASTPSAMPRSSICSNRSARRHSG